MQAHIISNLKSQMSNPDILVITPEKSIGIDEVRQIQTFLSRKPIQSPHNTVYLKDAHLLTIYAQNALLKILEEPPGNSEIYLVTDQPDMLLPTILSRVQISHITPISRIAPINPTGYNLDSLTTREQALGFLDGVENWIHDSINNSPLRPPLNLRGGSEGALYEIINKTRKYLKANCNIKLCLDYLAINLLSY